LVEKDLFKNEKALGKVLNVDGIAYKVIGVFQDSGGDNEERIIYMPYKTVQLLYGNNDHISQINLSYNMAMSTEQAIAFSKKIEEDFKEKFKVAPDDQSAIRVRSFAEDIKETMVILGGIYMIIFVIGIGTLISGIIGIGNIMTFSVKERTKELGIRKALGASPKSIIAMVLQESVLITSVAGYLGLILGILALKLIGNNLEEFFILNPKVDTGIIMIATMILIFFGLLAGYIPARRAARIKPIIALRDE
jgi:putative ABC transport system permease protein